MGPVRASTVSGGSTDQGLFYTTGQFDDGTVLAEPCVRRQRRRRTHRFAGTGNACDRRRAVAAGGHRYEHGRNPTPDLLFRKQTTCQPFR